MKNNINCYITVQPQPTATRGQKILNWIFAFGALFSVYVIGVQDKEIVRLKKEIGELKKEKGE